MARNRAEGWKHAKLSGHSNEAIITDKINLNADFKKSLTSRLGVSTELTLATVGGLNEKNVLDVFGGKTKSKTDLVLKWKDNSNTNISIKKSAGGQVYLIGIDRFLEGFRFQFKKDIPSDFERAIKLFIAGADDIEEILSSRELATCVTQKIREYEKYKNRLTWQSLRAYDTELSEALLHWIKANIKELALFCFQRGLAARKEDWADFVWYHNEVEEDVEDALFAVDEMVEELSSHQSISQITPGTVGGGTTIKLPFGFLQWHQGQLQFHHQQKVLLENCAAK